jgi:hypothetical protein
LRTEESVRRVVETDQRPLEVVNGMARPKIGSNGQMRGAGFKV